MGLCSEPHSREAWFGGKSRVAPLVWERFGTVQNFVEPFFGSGAVLLGRPEPITGSETVNDKDALVCNGYRAIRADPDAVAHWADYPANECIPAGTMIATPEGDVPAERIRAGMVVYGADGQRVVRTTVMAVQSSRTCEPLVQIGPLSLTGNHPVWTKELGYVCARLLTAGLQVGMICKLEVLDGTPLLQPSHFTGPRSGRHRGDAGRQVYNFQTLTGNYFANRILVHNCDLHARHAWLVQQLADLVPRVEGDPDWYDAKIAGWWLWGMASWIGSGFCSGDGPWQSIEDDDGVRRLLHLGNAGRGVQRQLLHLGDAGRGVQRQLLHLGDAERGVRAWMHALATRLRGVRVCCGDWSRVCGPTPTMKLGLTGVFLDPPYPASAGRDMELYRVDSGDVADEARRWAVAHGHDPLLRIALCGYDVPGMPGSWTCVAWKARGGYGSMGNGRGRENARREQIWFSPHCLTPSWQQGVLPLE